MPMVPVAPRRDIWHPVTAHLFWLAPSQPTSALMKTIPAQKPSLGVDLTDEQLMAMIQAHQHGGLDQLFRRYGTFLKCISTKVLHSDLDAEDLLQDVFLEIWLRAANYDPLKGKPLAWIITLTRRRSIDRCRRRETCHRLEERIAHETSNTSGGWTHVYEDIAHGEMNVHVQRALAALPEAQRKAVRLAYHRQMSQREIARHTGTALGTIKTRLELGLRKMASSLSGLNDLLGAYPPAGLRNSQRRTEHSD